MSGQDWKHSYLMHWNVWFLGWGLASLASTISPVIHSLIGVVHCHNFRKTSLEQCFQTLTHVLITWRAYCNSSRGSTFRVSDSGNVGWGLRIYISKAWPDGAVPGRPHIESHFDLLENHRRYQLYFNFKKERKKLQREKRGRQMIIWVSPYVSNFGGDLFFLVLINIYWGQDGLGIWG